MDIKEQIKGHKTKIQSIEDWQARLKGYSYIEEILGKEMILVQDELLKLKEQEKAEAVYDKNWRPVSRHTTLWYISKLGDVVNSYEEFLENGFYSWLDTTDNIYQTEAHCEKGKQAIKLIGEINQFAKVENGDWRADFKTCKSKYFMYVDWQGMKTDYSMEHNSFKKLPYFENKGIAHKAIEKFGTRLIELQAYI